MSTLRRSDHDMHYSNSSHRWIAPPHIEQSVWEAKVRAHVEQHRLTMGGTVRVEDTARRRTRLPRRPAPVTDTGSRAA